MHMLGARKRVLKLPRPNIRAYPFVNSSSMAISIAANRTVTRGGKNLEPADQRLSGRCGNHPKCYRMGTIVIMGTLRPICLPLDTPCAAAASSATPARTAAGPFHFRGFLLPIALLEFVQTPLFTTLCLPSLLCAHSSPSSSELAVKPSSNTPSTFEPPSNSLSVSLSTGPSALSTNSIALTAPTQLNNSFHSTNLSDSKHHLSFYHNNLLSPRYPNTSFAQFDFDIGNPKSSSRSIHLCRNPDFIFHSSAWRKRWQEP
ncbi:hypothetical protein PIB30_080825 [Stylosanthes scabra]|uniref:Uncharacterized protein n=1 Tax=Stylosanthes scabra TaxID=79078 RepID=A0ABU6VR64_9FABA|nr:hypothetical protein [Stylosanthes scabra]